MKQYKRRIRNLAIEIAGVAMVGAGALAFLSGCATSQPTPAKRESQARFLFNQAMRVYVVPAEAATNELDRVALLDQAEAAYQKIADEYPDAPAWAANAWRTLGQLKVQRGRMRDGLYCYDQVARLYPNVHWEVIQAWKAAADALWMSKLNLEAIQYYQKIVQTYGGKPGQPPMFETIVDISRSRLREPAPR